MPKIIKNSKLLKIKRLRIKKRNLTIKRCKNAMRWMRCCKNANSTAEIRLIVRSSRFSVLSPKDCHLLFLIFKIELIH